jgi:hypothetical protein
MELIEKTAMGCALNSGVGNKKCTQNIFEEIRLEMETEA